MAKAEAPTEKKQVQAVDTLSHGVVQFAGQPVTLLGYGGGLGLLVQLSVLKGNSDLVGKDPGQLPITCLIEARFPVDAT